MLAAIYERRAGTADSMIEWRWFDAEARIYGAALTPKCLRDPGIDPDPDVIRAYGRN
jgi:hypothetical protein